MVDDDRKVDPLLGRLIAGRYRLAQPLGAGGMGVVYLARHEGLERDVVVKVIRPESAGDPNAVARFEREARMAASVVHPNIVTVHDFGHDDAGGAGGGGGLFYLVMERLVGRSLRDVILRPPAPGDHPGPGTAPERIALEWPFATECVRQIALALGAAHAKGVLHRDLKPSNVFLLAGVGAHHVAKVLDFGLAKRVTQAPSELTRSGELIGTVGYAAPEQLTEGVSDARCDLFSLGVLWYELLAGKHPFLAETEAKTIVNQVQLMPPPPSAVERDVPPEVDDVVMRLLRKEPGTRTSSAEALLVEIERLTARAPVSTDAVRPATPTSAPATPDATRRIATSSGRVQSKPTRPTPAKATWLTAAVTVVAAGALVVALAAALAPSAHATAVVSLAPHNDASTRSLLPLPPRPELVERTALLVGLGRALYHDPILSGSGVISCATCHPMEHGGTTPEPLTRLGDGGSPAKWNTPTTWNATIVYRQTWRGDVETVAQVIERPLFNTTMMNAGTWEDIENKLQASPRHAELFAKAGVPVTRASVGEALTVYLDHAAPRNAPIDRFLRGDFNALDPVARAGLERFQALGCVTCHQGAGIGGNMKARFGVLAGAHPYADRGQCADGTFCRTDRDCAHDKNPPQSAREKCAPSSLVRPEDHGLVLSDPKRNPSYIFKVPSLRNVARTAPYFHDGSVRTLEDAVRTMAKLQLGVTLTDAEVVELVAFLDALSATLPDDEVRLAYEATRTARLAQ